MAAAELRPLIVLSDLHLAAGGNPVPARDAARLIAASSQHEIILAGDIFDLSLDPPQRKPSDSVVEILKQRPELRAALRAHLHGGAPVALVAGNHDASSTTAEVRSAVLSLLELTDAAPLSTAPWFVRRGNTHVEHGHLYDPDNAPTHPLALWSYATEPLGVALTRRFLAPNDALQFAHAHETTPLKGLLRAFALYRLRTPSVIARYFRTAIALCAQAGRSELLELEREVGAESIAEYAAEWGLDAAIVAQLAEAGPRPTHHRFRDVFMRLYFDRVIATLVTTAGASAGLVLASATGVGAAALGAAYLSASVMRGGNRYSGLPEQRLRDAAAGIRDVTGADLVIFGHTHREDQEPGYINSASFAYSRTGGRPFVRVDTDGRSARDLVPVAI